MKNKYSKTILAIVFLVVLMKLNPTKVDAASYVCNYSGDVEVTITIDSSLGKPKTSKVILNVPDSAGWDKGAADNEVPENWFSASSPIQFVAKKWVEQNGRCPENVLFIDKGDTAFGFHLLGQYHMYLVDSSNLNKEINNAKMEWGGNKYFKYVYGTLSSTTNPGNGDDSGVVKITERTCTCRSDKVKFTYKINSSLTQPRIMLKINKGDDNEEDIKNWFEPVKGTTYTARSDIGKNNKCPSKGLYTNSASGDRIYVSDDASYAAIKKAVTDSFWFSYRAYDLTCYEDTEPEPSSEGTGEINDPDYEWPDIDDSYITPGSGNFNTYSCGGGYVTDIPSSLPNIVRFVILAIQVVIPVFLVIFGLIDIMKAVSSQKEDEIKKGQQIFVKRLIVAAIIFFVFAFVKIGIGFVSEDSSAIIDCMNCFINGTDYCEGDA